MDPGPKNKANEKIEKWPLYKSMTCFFNVSCYLFLYFKIKKSRLKAVLSCQWWESNTTRFLKSSWPYFYN